VGVLLIAFFAMIIYPKYTELDTKADEATAAKNVAEAQLSAAKKLDPVEIDKRLGNLRARIPSTLAISNVIVRVTERAVNSNLVWLQGTPVDESAEAVANAAPTAGQDATLAPQLTRYDFSIVVKGQMTDFIKFMSDLTDKSLGRIVVINSMDVQFKTDEGPDAIEATLKLQVLGWDQGAEIGSDGCTKTPGETISGDDSKCNLNTVTKSKEGSS
ncbi:MAG TPA: hypothetical protein PLT55_02825, partial [Acidimicrobiia bacterium]|nr:hypothetical protein [Acidimicrobiia bacterium]